MSTTMERSASFSSTWSALAAAFLEKAKAATLISVPNPTPMKGRHDPHPSELCGHEFVEYSGCSSNRCGSSEPIDNYSFDDDEYDQSHSLEYTSWPLRARDPEVRSPSSSPIDFKNYPTAELVTIVAANISKVVHANDQVTNSESVLYHRGTSHARLLPWHFLSTAAKTQTLKSWPSTPFYTGSTFEISVEEYLQRVTSWCHTPNEVLISLLVYFDRLSELSTTLCATDCNEEKPFFLTTLTVQRAIIAGILVGTKYHDALVFDTSRYAVVRLGLPH